MMRWLGVLVIALLLSPISALAQNTVHGADSLFVSPALKLAWAVQRGASEIETRVIVRIVALDPSYRFVRLDGVDPFTKDRKMFVPMRPLDRETDLAIPRAESSISSAA